MISRVRSWVIWAGAELAGEFCLDLAHSVLDGVQGGVAAGGEVDAPGALVVTVAAAGEIAGLLQLPEQ